MPTDAERRYLASIVDDCRPILGPGVEIDGIERLDEDGQVRLTARYRIGGVEAESVAVGETIVDAHARLREQLVIDRLRAGFSALVDAGR